MLDNLRLDFVQGLVNLLHFGSLAFGAVGFGIPQGEGNRLLATELGSLPVHRDAPKNGCNTVLFLTAVHVKQHFKCVPHNSIFFSYKITFN